VIENIDVVAEIMSVALSDGDGYVAFLRAYMDESGTHDGSPVTSVGLCLAKPSTWSRWTKRWNAEKGQIKVFHASDCANLRGEFKGWKPNERDEFVKNLLRVIPELEILSCVVGFSNGDLSEVLKRYPKFQFAFDDPYEACFTIALGLVLDELNVVGTNDRFAIIHEDNDKKGALCRCVDFIRGEARHQNRNISITFAAKKEAVPLQAADIFAYEGNKRLRNPEGPERRAWRAINPNRDNVQLSYYGRKEIEKWLGALNRGEIELR